MFHLWKAKADEVPGRKGVVCERDYAYYMKTEHFNGSEGFDSSYLNMRRFVHIIHSLKIARHV